jgi:hypothetical protein
MFPMKRMAASLVLAFSFCIVVQTALPLAHQFHSSIHSNHDSHKNSPSPEVNSSPDSGHDGDSCAICQILATVQPGDVQAVSTSGVWISTADLAPVVSTLVIARGNEFTTSSPRAPPRLLKSIQG